LRKYLPIEPIVLVFNSTLAAQELLRAAGVFSEVTGERALSFHDLSVGEAPASLPEEGKNGGGGKFPSQISHRKDQPGSPWNERKDTSGPLIYFGCSQRLA
jgi:hypothetical protein